MCEVTQFSYFLTYGNKLKSFTSIEYKESNKMWPGNS